MHRMRFNHVLFLSLFILSLTGVAIAIGILAKAKCPPLNDTDKARLVDYVRKKYKVPTTAQLNVTEVSRVGSTC